MASSIQPSPPAISELRSGSVALRSQSKLNTRRELSDAAACVRLGTDGRGSGVVVTPGLYPKALRGASRTEEAQSIHSFWRRLRHRMYYSAPRITICHSIGATFVSRGRRR